MYDITIIGAGSAGATLARLLGNKFKILLIDKRELIEKTKENCFQKCCGGLLAPDAQKMLAKFGLGVPKDVLVGPQLFSVRTIDIKNKIEQHYQRHYINVDREKFDSYLVSLIPSNVEILTGSMFKIFTLNSDNTIEIEYNKDGKEYKEKTRLLIGADGAFSRVRRQAFPNHIHPKQYISIQEWYKSDNILPYYSSFFDNEITDFYSWTIPKEDTIILGTAVLPNDNSYKKFLKLKSKLTEFGFEFGECVKREGSYLLRPQGVNQINIGRNNIALIGEAAGWISPSSAEGISYSFKSALALAKALQDNPENYMNEYRKNTSDLRRNISIKLAKSPFMYNEMLRVIAMKSGIMSIEVG